MKNLHWTIKAFLIVVPTGLAIWGGYEAFRYYQKKKAETEPKKPGGPIPIITPGPTTTR